MKCIDFFSLILLFTKGLPFSSVTQSCPILCDPMDCNMPRLPVHHQLPEFTLTRSQLYPRVLVTIFLPYTSSTLSYIFVWLLKTQTLVMGFANTSQSQVNLSISINLMPFFLLVCAPWGFPLLSHELT